MTFEYPKAGVNAAVEYMVSGLPWVTSSNVSSSVAAQIDFPMVTSNITVRNNAVSGASNLKFGYSANGVRASNYFLIEPQTVLCVNVRVKSVFLMSTSSSLVFSVHAGLTTIESRGFPVLTGSAIYGTAGATSGSYGYGKIGDWGVTSSAAPGGGNGTG